MMERSCASKGDLPEVKSSKRMILNGLIFGCLLLIVVMIITIMLGPNASADDTIDVTVETVDQDGESLNGRVWIITPYSWQDSPYTYEQINGDSNRFYGRWGGLSTGWTDWIEIYKDTTYSIDAATREITSESTPGDNLVYIVFESMDFTVETIAHDGQHLDGIVRVSGYNSWQDSPFTYAQTNGGGIRFYGRWGGLSTGWTESTKIFKDTTYTINALTREITSKKTPNKNKITIVFEPIKVTVSTVDPDGKKLDGRVWVNVPYTWQDSPLKYTQANGGSNRFYGRWGDLSTGWSEWIVVSEHTTYTMIAQTGEITSTPTNGKTIVNIVFEPIEVTVTTVDTEGNLLEGTVRVIGHYSWQDSPFEYEQANGGRTRYYGRWGGLSIGWTDYVVIKKDTTYTINAQGEITSTSSPGVNKVNIVYEPIEVTVTNVDPEGEPLDGRVWIITPYTWQDSPITYVQADGGSNRFYGRWGGLSTGWTGYLEVHKDTTYSIDALSGEISSETTTGVNKVNIVFEPLEVTVTTVDPEGDPLDGSVRVISPYTRQDSPLTYEQANGGRNRFYGLWGGLAIGWTDYVVIQKGTTYTIDAGTGEITSESTEGVNKVNIVFEPIEVTLEAVDQYGNSLDGRVWTRVPYQWKDSPITYEQAEGGRNRYYGRWGGLSTGWTDYVEVHKDNTYLINAHTGEITTTPTSDVNRVYIVFESIEVTVQTVDKKGNPLDGIVRVLGHSSYQDSPMKYNQANGGSARYYGRWGGLATGWTESTEISKDTTYSIDAQTGKIKSSKKSDETRIDIVYDPIEVTVETVDLKGNSLEGTVLVTGHYSWQDSPFTYEQANGGSNRYYGRWGALSTGWSDYVVVQKDTTYSINAQTGEITSKKTPHTNKVNIVFEPIEVTVATIDQDGNSLDGTVRIILPYSTDDSPLTYEQANGGSNRFYGLWGSLSTGWSDYVKIEKDTTYTINAQTGEVSSTPTNGKTLVNIVFEPIEVTVTTVDQEGNSLEGTVLVTGHYSWQDSPFTYEQANGGSPRYYGRWGGLSTGWSDYVEVEKDTTYTIIALTGVITSTPTDGKTQVNIVFEPIEVTVSLVDQDGNSLDGRVWVNVPYTWQDSPITYEQANGGRNRFYGRWEGQSTGWSEWVEVSKDTTYSIDAGTGEITSTSTPGVNRVYIVFSTE